MLIRTKKIVKNKMLKLWKRLKLDKKSQNYDNWNNISIMTKSWNYDMKSRNSEKKIFLNTVLRIMT